MVIKVHVHAHAHFIDVLLMKGWNILVTGDTGIVRCISINQNLLHGIDYSVYQNIQINFWAQISTSQFQDIDFKLDERRSQVYGPLPEKKIVSFVKVLNAFAKETYGVQPPIETLRLLDHGGWFDRKLNEFHQLVDTLSVSAMGPPGGEWTRITQRMARHFNVLRFVPFEESSLEGIFGLIMDWYLQRFSTPLKAIGCSLVLATIDMYHAIVKRLFPTSHYAFNLRDLSKIFQSFMQAFPAAIKQPTTNLARLWSHERTRVFHDRLIDDDDRQWFNAKVIDICQAKFNMKYEQQVQGSNAILIYGHFGDRNRKAQEKSYTDIPDHVGLKMAMENHLEEYSAATTVLMNLVLFLNAIKNISRISQISRVTNQPKGNALLVGVVGSGRKSVIYLAVFIAKFELFQIDISKTYGKFEWWEDLKAVFNLAGVEDKLTAPLFSDTQIVQESLLEDVNGILNTGEVANLYNSEEKTMLLEAIAQQATKVDHSISIPAEIYDFFVESCNKKLHMVCLTQMTYINRFPAEDPPPFAHTHAIQRSRCSFFTLPKDVSNILITYLSLCLGACDVSYRRYPLPTPAHVPCSRKLLCH